MPMPSCTFLVRRDFFVNSWDRSEQFDLAVKLLDKDFQYFRYC